MQKVCRPVPRKGLQLAWHNRDQWRTGHHDGHRGGRSSFKMAVDQEKRAKDGGSATWTLAGALSPAGLSV